ncbi:MAG: hypothetical protein LBH05_07060 [Deferribacteraceae bacterium]|jgi:hypothetical protein|nr:hypothetical protein [Deferribacteraceae bacterium]
MQYDVKLVKLVSGDTVMGNYDAENKTLNDVVIIQAVPAVTGSVQLAMLPFGFPYEEEINAKLDERHIMYQYAKIPEELKNKYLEAKSNIKIASSLNTIHGKDSGSILL